MEKLSAIAGVALFLIATIVVTVSGTNPHTPQGHEGYIVHDPMMFGQREFIEVQAGPTSTGWRWRQYATNIDMRIQTFSEELHIFSSDNLEVHFEAHARIRLRPGSVKDIVERYSGDAWFATNVRRIYRTAVREEVRRHAAFDIKDLSVTIAETVLGRLREEFEETPFEFLDLSIGNIDYPDSVEERVVANLAAEQRRQRMEVERRIAEQRATIREVRARGAAQSQQIEQETLTPLFVQHEAAELLVTLADDTGTDDDGASAARVTVVVPTRVDQAGVTRIYTGGR